MNDKIFPESKWKRLVSKERDESLNREKFFEISKPHKDEVWADIGCGPGYFTLPLAHKVKKIFAIDISEKMLTVCKKRAEKESLNNIEYIESTGESINLQPDTLDKALLVNVLHEFIDKEKAVREINKLLHLKGYAFVIDWKYEDMDFGPPFGHRLPTQKVVHDFITNGFTFLHSWIIYEHFYFLVFKKTKELE
ncbi:MAG: class I SAM-dependent methyltransferase [Chlorobi bacterium]|nr:class I SAM-dependent methyltransferase [Chlorobiota bacterium]